MKRFLVFLSILAIVFVPFLNVSKIDAYYYKPLKDYNDYGFDYSRPLYFSNEQYYYDLVFYSPFFKDEWGNSIDLSLPDFIDYYFENVEYALGTNSYVTYRLHINQEWVYFFDRYQQLISFPLLDGNQKTSYTDYIEYGVFKLRDISYVELSMANNYDVIVGFKNAYSAGYALSFLVANAGDNISKMSREYITNREAIEFYGRDMNEYYAWKINSEFDRGVSFGENNANQDFYDLGFEDAKEYYGYLSYGEYISGTDAYNLGGSENTIAWNVIFGAWLSTFQILSIELFPNLTLGMIMGFPLILGLLSFIIGVATFNIRAGESYSRTRAKDRDRRRKNKRK
ncbi:MAG: hypothetical protein M0R46_17865 [Candidatus Muirbacterium halophilum]|nr:hypothetical protein [Candidatus Muirbacterium halophilum]